MDNSEKTQRKKRAMNPKSLANLIPFEKGQSGNPEGPKAGYKQRNTLLREVVDFVSSFKNPLTKETEKMEVEMALEYAIVGKALKGDVSAYREIKDSLYGKINDTLDIGNKNGEPFEQKIQVEFIDDKPAD
jgi:hypothetical protein